MGLRALQQRGDLGLLGGAHGGQCAELVAVAGGDAEARVGGRGGDEARELPEPLVGVDGEALRVGGGLGTSGLVSAASTAASRSSGATSNGMSGSQSAA